MTSRRRLAGLLAVLLLGGVGAYLGIRSAQGGSVAHGGPLAPPKDGNFFGVGSQTDPGEPWSYGLLVVSNKGNTAADLDRVELLKASPHISVIGAYAQPTQGGHGVGLLPGFPQPDASPLRRPLAGYEVEPGQEIRVVVGLRVDRNGRYQFAALRLFYRVGNRRYLADWPLAVQFCAPASRWFGRCEAPAG